MDARREGGGTIVEMEVEDTRNGWHGARERKKILAMGTFGRTLFRYRSSASPTSCGKGSFASLRPLPQTRRLPCCQSMSLMDSLMMSPARIPRRASSIKMARSRMPFGAESHELINTSTLPSGTYLG